MDIEYLRLEALKLAVHSHGAVLPPGKIVEAAGRYVGFLVGEAGPATSEPPRTLESEGQKWDEEARAKSGQVSLTTEQLGRIWANGRDQKVADEAARRPATVDVLNSRGVNSRLTSEELYTAIWAHHDSLRKSDGHCPSSEHHGC